MNNINDETPEEMFLKRDGRLNRLRYFKRSLVVGLASIIINFPVIMIFSDDFGNLSPFGNIVSSATAVAFLIPLYCLDVRRLHDLDKDETLAKVIFVLGIIMTFGNSDPLSPSAFIMIVSFVAVVICLYMLFAPGTKGENKYGADPLG